MYKETIKKVAEKLHSRSYFSDAYKTECSGKYKDTHYLITYYKIDSIISKIQIYGDLREELANIVKQIAPLVFIEKNDGNEFLYF